MKKKILALCLLTALCIPMFCDEVFRDGDAYVTISYINRRGNLPGNWPQSGHAALHRAFATLGATSDFPINKLSDADTRRINKALQRFELAKDEVYGVTWGVTMALGLRRTKMFYVLITDVKGEQYWWEWVGREATYSHPVLQ